MSEREIAEALIQFALAPTVAIGIAAAPPISDADALRSASGALVYLDGVPFLVTNWHVIEAYRVFAAQRETQFFFADNAIDPIERLHSENRELDLAVLFAYNLRVRADRNRGAGVPNIKPYQPNHWPPAPPESGDNVFFAGWPEVARQVDFDQMEAAFQPYAYVGATIHETTNHSFTIQFDRSQFRGVTGNETREQLEQRNLTGLSGAPIFRSNPNVAETPDLVGFVKEYSANWDLLIATSAMNLDLKGRVHPID